MKQTQFDIVHGTRNTELLKSASKYGQNLKAISVTGSINAITTGDPEDLKSRELTSDSWNFVSAITVCEPFESIGRRFLLTPP